jgi:MtN3 and saliva related transmembrane protein
VSFGVILGLIAGAITTFSLVPQIVRVFRLKTAREISLFFTVMFIVGSSVWLSYGIYFKLLPVIIWNTLAIILAMILLFGKLKYAKSHSINGKTGGVQ